MKRLWWAMLIVALGLMLTGQKCQTPPPCQPFPQCLLPSPSPCPACPSPSPCPSPEPSPSPSPSAEPSPSPSPSLAPPSPVPGPSPSAQPGCPAGYSDVANLLVLNYAKCAPGQPFVFFLNRPDCKELLVTATPKSADQSCGKACDAKCHGRLLRWTVITWDGLEIPSPDDTEVQVPDSHGAAGRNWCATVSPGPVEVRFNRTIVGMLPCQFDLRADLVAPDGREFTKRVTVTVK